MLSPANLVFIIGDLILCAFPFLGISCYEITSCLCFCWCSQFPWVEVLLLVFCVGLGLWIGLLNLVLSCNILFCPSMVIESFAGYRSLGWHLWSLNVCIMLDQDLLAFIVSIEKSGIFLIGMPLYVTWPFSFAALNILSLFFVVSVLIIMWQKDFFGSSLFGVL